jgi:hypothetical protein
MAAPLPPDDESAVPAELVPGAVGLVPNDPPVTEEWCDPMPPPRLWAAGATPSERRSPKHSAAQRRGNFFFISFIAKLPLIAGRQRSTCAQGFTAHAFLSVVENARTAPGGCFYEIEEK